jgi:aspartyl-tRNA(Asn)/glutamyl-tRNA(Gln) amidotransferase subunit C
MAVTTDDIHHIARLARLTIDEAQIPAYTKNLNDLLALVAQMQRIDTNNIQPMSHPQEGQQQRLRDDLISESNQRELFQAIAPHVAEGLYIVPKVIE